MRSNYLRILVVIVCLLNIYTLSAQVRQVGKVVELNSNGRAISGASIEVISADDVQPAVSDNNGVFILNFSKKKKGDMAYNLRVYKSGYEVVNSQIVNSGVVLTDCDTLKIVLANPAKLAEARANYYQIFDNYHVGLYKKQADELKNKLQINELALGDYETRLAAAEKELQDVATKISDYADRFSRINKDDMDSVSRCAFVALDNGDVEGALRVYSSFNSYDRLVKKIMQRDDANASIKALIPGMLDEIEVRRMVGGVENRHKIGEMYVKIIEADSLSDGWIFHDAVRFFCDEVDVEKVMKYGRMAERNFNSRLLLSYVFMYMGRMAARVNDLENARIYLGRAITAADEARALGIDDSYFDVMINYPMHELGLMYYENCEYDKSEQTIRKTLKIRKRLAEADEKFTGEYTNSLSGFALILSDVAKYDSSLICINEAIETETRILPKDPQKFAPMLAHFNSLKGRIYMNMGDYQSAKPSFVEALRIFDEYGILNYNIDSYLYALLNLARCECALNETDAAAECCTRLFDQCKKYGQGNNYYDEYYAVGNECYGDALFKEKDYTKALECYDVSKEIYEQSADKLKGFKFHLVNCYIRIGRTYLELGEIENAEESYLKAYAVAKEFYDENNDVHQKTFVKTSGKVADFYKKIGKKRMAKKYEKVIR